MAHGTIGLGDHCAVSKRLATGVAGEAGDVPVIEAYLLAGYAIALTDYQGLGTPGTHQYLMRKAQGHAVIDATRAAQRSGGSLPKNGPVFFAGFSQGGFSASAAAELQPTYAPELSLQGLIAAGVPGDLAATLKFLEGSPSDGILLFVANGLNAAYPKAGIMKIFNEAGTQAVNNAARQCVEDVTANGTIRSWTLTKDGRTLSDHLINDFGNLLSEQMIGRLKPTVPVLTGISNADDVVPYEANRGTAQRWCTLGATVQFETILAPGHASGSIGIYAQSLPWISTSLLGLPSPSNCGAY
ncbi:lipase family protein [Pseudarthrobacter scleromae]|uniref:lipase family protein n=1 Tax=Pseudarthrobacter scleromae TaxID=158897 RepID=UPI003D049D6E